MGSPLSKCCREDTTDAPVPSTKKGQATASTGTTGTAQAIPSESTSALVDTSGQRIEATNAATKSSSLTPSTKTPRNVFKRISTQISTLGNQKNRSIEQGLKTLPFTLTEEEKRILLANEIPASEIKKLSIGIDAGGMGVIHMAEWKGQKVAIKEASSQVISKEASVHDFCSCISNAGRMKGCEGVIPFYGVTFPPGLDKMCIVTKYAEKGSLTWHLKVEYQNLTWDDKLRLATQISSGIARLHEEGIYHRDLHGGNILIDEKGNAMLTDFGASTIMEERVVRNVQEYAIVEAQTVEGRSKFISKKIVGLDVHENNGKQSGDTKRDAEGDRGDPLIGVMAYIAPERFRNPKFFDAKCDIYSLGVLLWELTTGHPAFSKVPQDVHLAIAIMNGKRELPVEGTPTEYKALYERCWQTEAALRPSLPEILETLAKVRASMTTEQLAVTRSRSNTQYDSVDAYEESLSIPRPTSDIQQHFLSEYAESSNDEQHVLGQHKLPAEEGPIPENAYDALYSRAIFLGKDTTDPLRLNIDTFKEPRNHPAAVASIILQVASQVHFKPDEDKTLVLDPEVFARFEFELLQLSAFELVESKVVSLELTGNLKQFACEVFKKYPSTADPALIAEALQQLVPSSLTDASWQDILLSLVLIQKADDSDEISVDVASIAMVIVLKEALKEGESSGPAVIAQQKATLTWKRLRVVANELVEHAEVWDRTVYPYDVTDFLQKLTSVAATTQSPIAVEPSELFGRARDPCPGFLPEFPELPDLPDVSIWFGKAIDAIKDAFKRLPDVFSCLGMVFLWAIGGAVMGFIVAWLMICVVCCVGFTPQGIAAGSIAAFLMSLYMGFTPAGSIVAVLQALGATAVNWFTQGFAGAVFGMGYGVYYGIEKGICHALAG
ncbi:hypothetical protein KVV02_001273 [Mortierella alpina]|uniref:Protein kinase domain-containing protein n=1 Tax=Mortierella alpina TaxID=64518 RepID=A0A9P7ZZI3_MORAP|nr:hypothetical protein KVV02_001273 [Mortierella alpina]